MSAPVQNTQIVAQGLARLTGAYINQPNIRAWLMAILTEVQVLEDATFSVYSGRILANAQQLTLPATNPVFDSLGSLVGQKREGLSDAQYVTAIRLRVAVNRSTGRTTDWSRFAAILLPWSTGIFFLEQEAAVRLGAWDLTLDPNIVGSLLALAPANGVGGLFAYTTWAEGNDFEFGSVSDATAGQGKWGSVYSASTGGVFAAAVGL